MVKIRETVDLPFPIQNVNKIYTPLNTDWARILEEILDKPYFESCPTSSHSRRGDQNWYCNYHQYVGYSTEDYRQLKNLIEKNVQNGELIHYVTGREGLGRRRKDANKEQHGVDNLIRISQPVE